MWTFDTGGLGGGDHAGGHVGGLPIGLSDGLTGGLTGGTILGESGTNSGVESGANSGVESGAESGVGSVGCVDLFADSLFLRTRVTVILAMVITSCSSSGDEPVLKFTADSLSSLSRIAFDKRSISADSAKSLPNPSTSARPAMEDRAVSMSPPMNPILIEFTYWVGSPPIENESSNAASRPLNAASLHEGLYRSVGSSMIFCHS